MKNKAIITSLIIIMVGIIALGIGWHKIFDASATKPNLIECKGHIDKNQDMSCDICGAILSGESDTKYKTVKNTLESGTTIEVKGDMPSNAVLTTKEITKEVATNIAKRYIPLDDDKVLYAYDISMVLKNKKYQPENYGKDVNITLTNLEIEDQKDVAVMHIIDNKSYEIMKLDELTKNKVSFKTTSFSTYIVLKVATYNVTFTGTGNFEVQTLRGNKITNSTELVSGTKFTFVVTPKAGYGISGITTSNGTITTNGDVLRKTAIIDNITQATTITVTTVAAPVVTKQPVTVKVNSGETAIYTVTAQNATTYEWQYRTNENDYWKSASEIGTTNSGTLTITNVTDAINGYSIRCMLSNDSFDNGYEVKTDMAYVILTEGTLQMPVAIDEPIKEESKMITEWTIPADNTTIKLPVAGTGLNVTVDWGDGSATETFTTDLPEHTYATAGTYEIKVWGICPKWGYAGVTSVTTTQNSDYYTYTQYLTKVKQFGELSATQYGFAYCKNLKEVFGENLVTNKTFEKMTSMQNMFANCSGLTNLDVSNFDTSNVTYMGDMFAYCSGLTSLDVSKFDTSNVTYMYGMFEGCSGLTSLDVSNFDTSKVTGMSRMFEGCSGLTSLDVSKFDTSNVTYMYGMFERCTGLTSLDVSKFDTSKVTDMSGMFKYCSGLTSLDVSNFDTSNVTDMRAMFYNCSGLTSLDVSKFDTSKVTYMQEMFRDCWGLTSLDVSKFDTSNVTNMRWMFDNCSGLTSLDVSKFDTSNVTYMEWMFYNCKGLTSLDVSKFDTSKVTSMKYMLRECSGLTNLNLSNFDTSKVTDMGGMFYRCSNLKSLQLSNKFKIPSSSNANMFANTTNLTSIILVDSTPLAGQFTNIKAQLDGKTFYVPSKVAETAYETSWSADFSGDRIQPILKLVGDENVTINAGDTYTDAGYTVAGFDTANSGDYTVYGYNVTTSGEVNTAVAGTYKIDYTLTRTYNNAGVAQTDTLMTVTRSITVKEVIKETSKMITEWNVSGDAGLTIKLPAQSSGDAALNITVDWGDGTAEQTVTTSFPTHTYATAGTYEIKVWGTCPKWGYASDSIVITTRNSDYYTYTQYLSKVKQFGELGAQQYGFAQCKNLTEVSGENLVTNRTFEKTTSMAYMFSYSNLTSLDVSGFDTSKVTDMSYMFHNCMNLTSLDLSGFDTSKVTDMSYMFYNCIELTSLDVSKFNTSKVTDMSGMFYNCSNLTSLDVSGFDTSKVTDMSGMFSFCSNLTSLDVSGFDTSNVTNMSHMFSDCSKLTSLDVSRFDTSNVTDMSYMFDRCSNLTSLNVSGFDTSNVSTMLAMFQDCSGLTSLDVSGFDTAKVTNMSSMFSTCRNLTSLDVSGFDTSNVTTMTGMFNSCSNLTSLDVSGFDTSKVTKMSSMFNRCSNLTSLDVSEFDTAKVTDMSLMFYYCSNLTSLDVSGFDTAKVTNMSSMFSYCNKLRTLQLSNKFKIPTSNNADIFTNTTNLNSIIIIDTEPLASQFTSVKNQLAGKIIYVPNKEAEIAYEKSWSGDFSGDRVQPILELVGEEKITINKDETYTEAGATVAGFTKANSGDYTVYGYNLTSSGEVDTANAGTYKIEYTLTRTYENGTGTVTEEIMKATRTVEVIDTASYMITEWTIPSANTTIKLPVQGTGLNITVDWGDGSAEQTVTTAFPTHIYAEAGTYEIKVRGNCPEWGYASSSTVSTTSDYYTYTQYLTKVKQFGELNATRYGFARCTSLTEVSGENLVTSKTFEKVTSMEGMFYNCEGLINLDLSNFDTSKVTSMSRMFDGCSRLTNLDVSGFDTSQVTSMYQMFYVCSSLTNLDLSGFNTSKVTNMGDMFYHCSSLTNLDVSRFDTSSVTYMGLMFADCSSLTNLDVSRFDTSKVTNMGVMFYNCEGLTNLDVSGFNTSKVTEMGLMFAGCSSLTNLDVSGFDTSNVTSMQSMFRDCSKLTNLDVSRFNTSQVTDMISMFDGCSSLTNLDVSRFDTSNVTSMSGMFAGCSSLTSLDVSRFNTSKVTDMYVMFSGCSNLKTLQLSNKYAIPTSNATNMFTNTTNLNSIILVDNIPLANQFTNVKDQLNGKKIYVPNKVAETTYEESWSGDFTADRIQPILELVGKENITLNVGNTYTDEGYTVAGFDKTNSGDYTVYGYNVTTSGEVNTAVAGKYTIEYILTRTHNNGTGTVTEEIMKATRTVEVIDTASYMITEWNVSGDAGLTIKLPAQGIGLNITVDWGDGSDTETFTTAFPTHTYATAGTYEIKVWGTCPEWGYSSRTAVKTTSDYYTYTQYLTKVKQFGELNAIRYGFAQCENLVEVSGENLVTSKTFEKTTSMAYMFYQCSSITNLDVSNFDTSKATTMSYMFFGCSNLTKLDVSNFDTSKVTTMSYMFFGCSNLTKLDVSNFDTSKVTIMSYMFGGCRNLKSLDVSDFDVSNVSTMECMFAACSNLISLDVSNFNTSNVTNMGLMFSSCRNLTSLDLSNFDTSNVINMTKMFNGCANLKELNLNNFNTLNVTKMSSMFRDCGSLTSLNVSSFDTSKVTDMSEMFYNCSSLTSLDISKFDTSKVTDMSRMFRDCRNLTSLDVSNFDTSNVKSTSYMFDSCTNLKSLQLSNKFKIPTSKNTDIFANTTSLNSLILVDTEPLASQFTSVKSQITGKTIYVPNKVAETAYETAWASDFTADRIRPILELVGKENITLNVGNTYTDAGYTVAGFTEADSGAYTCYGYSVSSSGEVNTAVAGKYKITYKVTRTYEKDGQTITTQPYEVTREITVMALPLAKPTLIGTYTYNGLIQTAQLKTVNESRFEITNNTRKDAGTQEITVSIKDKNTYAWEDGTTDDIKITWEIKPIIAEITWSATTIEYDGTSKTVTATVSNAVNGEVITVTEYEGTTTAVNVGEYTAKVKSLSSTNYTLEGALNTEKKWYIQVTVVDMQVIMKDYSYGGTLPTPSITNNSAGRKVTYYYSENDTNQGGTDWSTVKDSFALPVGTYYMYAIVEANQNYQETLTDPVSFKVLGTELKVSVTKENKIEYDGNWVNQNVYIYITVEGNANVTAYQYKIGTNGSWIDKVTSPVILQNNMNGEVIVRGVNPAGKAVTSEKSAGLIKIDKTVPSITNVSYKNENKELSITATINDNLSGITAYAITAENGIREWIESTQGTKQAIVDGSGTYTIWAKDEAGNIGYETIDVVKDIHAPVGTIIVKDAYTVENNIYYTNQMNVILQITATDDISTSNQIKMAIYKEDDYNALTSEDEIVWEQYKENKQWTLTKENADEKIYLILKDMAGNISVKVGK